MLKTTSGLKKAKSIIELTDIDFLSEIFGQVGSIEKQPLKTPGFSGASHERIILRLKNNEVISLILKRIMPSGDVTIWRSGNIPNREARLLDSEELKGVWEIITSPYVAFYLEEEQSALLMHDLSNFLFPDVREPITIDQEDLILEAFARMHARYWECNLQDESWLAKQEVFFNYLGPLSTLEEKALGHEHFILNAAEQGWNLVFQNLPGELKSFLTYPPIEKIIAGLPKTLIHGDFKIGNLAILPSKKVAAFDWTVAAYASPAIEIGWYITVNASRLARSKESVLNRYRELVQIERGQSISNEDWNQMVDAAVMAGAGMLLWNKALNVQKGLPGAKEEWEWWAENIKKSYERNK